MQEKYSKLICDYVPFPDEQLFFKTFSISYFLMNAICVNQIKILIPHILWEASRWIEDEGIRKLAINKLTSGKEFFTEKSPLYEAYKTKILNCYGGNVKCDIYLYNI